MIITFDTKNKDEVDWVLSIIVKKNKFLDGCIRDDSILTVRTRNCLLAGG